MKERRIVITGTGSVNPLGNDVTSSWKNLLNGSSGISQISRFDASTYTSQIAGEVKNFDYKKYYKEENLNKVKRLDLFVHYAQAAVKEALLESGVNSEIIDPTRIGVCLGSGIGGMPTNLKQSELFHTKGHRRINPFFIPVFIGNMASGFIAIENNFLGPNMSTQTACATGNHAIISSFLMIKNGLADVILAGGTEGIIEPMTIAGFCNMRALSTSFNESPKKASRPFDKDRDGFVISEGAGVVVLEEFEHAKKRNANILCELVGIGMSGDAYDMVIPCKDGSGAHRSMKQALEFAEISHEKLNYINCHGTSTPLGDIAETKAIKQLLQDFKKTYIGSTKSMTGHLIGAAAALEAIFAIKVLTSNIVPPNININNFDENIVLDENMINQEVIETSVNYSLSNSFGFGGHNSTIIFKKI